MPTVIVLAAGEGTRMRSARLPKVLHGFAGRTMLGHVLAATAGLTSTAGPTSTADTSTAGATAAGRTAVVVGHGREQVTAELATIAPWALPVVQAQQRGTGHAVRLALEALDGLDGADPSGDAGTVVVVPGDAPLLTADDLTGLVAAHEDAGAAATLLTSVVADPTGYGRVLRDGTGRVQRVVEQKDATPAQLAVDEVATSVYAFDGRLLRDAVARLGSDNAAGEEYLTDVVEMFTAEGRVVAAVTAPAAHTAGVNDRAQLAAARRVYNDRLLAAHLRAGVTVVDPLTTWVDADVVIAPDTVLHPSVELHGTTRIGTGAEIGPQCTLTDTVVGEDARVQRAVAIGAEIGDGASVGPFAYLRPGARLAAGAHVGTYVEVKNSDIGEGSKVPHLTYVGDATIGRHSNIGASSVFVNYDGVEKHRSRVGDHVRVGSDTMIVAPRDIGDGAYTAAGSVITQDVPPGAMAVARARQRNVAGWTQRRRAGTASAEAADRAARADPPPADPPPADPPPVDPPPVEES